MRHGDVFRKLGRTTAERRQLFQNQITSLIRHDHIRTTVPKAKKLRRMVEKTITAQKRGTVLSLKSIGDLIKAGDVLTKLSTELIDRYKNRTGGYTRIWLNGYRKGDNAPMAIIELVDSPTDIKKAFESFSKNSLENTSNTESMSLDKITDRKSYERYILNPTPKSSYASLKHERTRFMNSKIQELALSTIYFKPSQSTSIDDIIQNAKALSIK